MARSHHDGPADAGPDLLPLRSAAAGISLQPVLESLVSTILTEYEGRGRGGVTVSIDAEVDVAAASVAGLTDLLTPLVAAACEAAATAPERLREVIITAVQTATTLEIEVADSAPSVSGDHSEIAGRLESLARRLGGHLDHCHCPDGGTAVTLHLPRRRSGSLAA